MLQIKFEKQEHQNKLFIDSIKLAVTQHLEQIHLNRLKTLPNKSNLLLAINQKSIRKIKTETGQKIELQRKGSLMSAIKGGGEGGPMEFLDSHMDFRQYESNYKGEIQRRQSLNSPNIKPKDITIKQVVPSRVVIKDRGFQEEQRSKDKIKAHSRNQSKNYLQKHPLVKFETLEPKKKEVSNRLFPSLPMMIMPRLKHFNISYKEILFGRSLQLNKKESANDLHSSCQVLHSSIRKRQPTKLPNLALSRSLDNSLRVSQEGTSQPQKKTSIPIKIKKKVSQKYASADLNFSPWSTKRSHFKGK